MFPFFGPHDSSVVLQVLCLPCGCWGLVFLEEAVPLGEEVVDGGTAVSLEKERGGKEKEGEKKGRNGKKGRRRAELQDGTRGRQARKVKMEADFEPNGETAIFSVWISRVYDSSSSPCSLFFISHLRVQCC